MDKERLEIDTSTDAFSEDLFLVFRVIEEEIEKLLDRGYTSEQLEDAITNLLSHQE